MKSAVSFSALLLFVRVAIADNQAQTISQELSPTEKWVVTQVTAGEIADLNKEFAEEAKRKLSAHFLEELLTGTLPGVKPRRNGVRISGATVDEPMDLTNAQIPYAVWLDHCRFMRPVTFQHATFAGKASFYDSTFKADANFSSMKVGDAAVFDNAVFEGAVNFVSAYIVGNFEALEAQFKNEKQSANFNSMKVGDAAFFRRAVFEGTADFLLADIGSNFEAQGVQFTNKEQGAYFYGMKVGQIASFKKAVFEGRVEFDAADIAANFEADEAQFRSKAETVRLVMKCGMQGIFKGVTFAGPVSFRDSSFLDLVIGDMKPGTASIPQLDLSRSSIRRHLSIRKIRIQDLVAPWLHVGGPADFTDVTVEHSADLSYGDFSMLDLSRTAWPKDVPAFYMQGMTYKYIRAAPNESESHEALLKLANRSVYTADVYSNLEMFFARLGNRDDADRAFIAGKCRERKEYLHGLSWLGSWMLYLLVGYGRHPSQAGYLCVFFVFLGCFFFSPHKMEPQKPKEAPRIYNRFWYSLDLFLPFINLQADDVWKPKTSERFLRHYVRLHVMLGWILIPILLAAIGGLIK